MCKKAGPTLSIRNLNKTKIDLANIELNRMYESGDKKKFRISLKPNEERLMMTCPDLHHVAVEGWNETYPGSNVTNPVGLVNFEFNVKIEVYMLKNT